MTMNWIVAKKELGKHHLQLEINAPSISKQWQAGHFVKLKASPNSLPLPAYITEANPQKGTIKIHLQKFSTEAHWYSSLNTGSELFDVSGPYGLPFDTATYGTVLCAAEAGGIIPFLPLVKALKASGNRVLVMLSAKTGDAICLEKEINEHADEVVLMTDDGSKGKKGLLVQGMKEMLGKEKINKIYVIGSSHLVKYASLLLQKRCLDHGVFLFSNPGLSHRGGMIYNISKASSSKSIVVDGPDLNAYYPNFDALVQYWGPKEVLTGSQDYQEAENTMEYSYLSY